MLILLSLSLLFYHGDYWYYSHVWPWLSHFRSAIAYLPECFFSWTFFQNIGLNIRLSSDFLKSNLYLQLGYSTGEFQICNWFPLRYLVPWINYLFPVYWSVLFLEITLNDRWFVCLTQRKTPFYYSNFLYACVFACISISRNIIIHCFVCLIFTSQIVFYFCQVQLYFLLP